MYAYGFRVCFTPLFTVLFTFPSQYWFTIGLPILFSLAGWTPRIQTGLHVSRPTQVPDDSTLFTRTGLSPTAVRLPSRFRFTGLRLAPVLLPPPCRNIAGLGSSHFARHYSGNRSFFLFLQVIRCFSSLRALITCVMCHAFSMAGSPIRIRADQFSFADPRTFSQLTASFIALGSPGILRMHFSRFSCGFCSC